MSPSLPPPIAFVLQFRIGTLGFRKETLGRARVGSIPSSPQLPSWQSYALIQPIRGPLPGHLKESEGPERKFNLEPKSSVPTEVFRYELRLTG